MGNQTLQLQNETRGRCIHEKQLEAWMKHPGSVGLVADIREDAVKLAVPAEKLLSACCDDSDREGRLKYASPLLRRFTEQTLALVVS